MSSGLPLGLNVTLYPNVASWGALREFVRMADALAIPDETDLRCVYDENNDFEGIALGPEDGSSD